MDSLWQSRAIHCEVAHPVLFESEASGGHGVWPFYAVNDAVHRAGHIHENPRSIVTTCTLHADCRQPRCRARGPHASARSRLQEGVNAPFLLMAFLWHPRTNMTFVRRIARNLLPRLMRTCTGRTGIQDHLVPAIRDAGSPCPWPVDPPTLSARRRSARAGRCDRHGRRSFPPPSIARAFPDWRGSSRG